MKHKWHKEIKAWADGAEIEVLSNNDTWGVQKNPTFAKECEYRIKPTPKKPRYLYAYYLGKEAEAYFYDCKQEVEGSMQYLGKIKLEE